MPTVSVEDGSSQLTCVPTRDPHPCHKLRCTSGAALLSMHCDLMRCLAILAAIRLLVLADANAEERGMEQGRGMGWEL